MTSNNHNIHPEYDPNKTIKPEPGTTFESNSASTSATIQDLITNVKVEPGLPTTTRLPSLRAPRDLTLGGNIKFEKPKRVFTPNVNVQRRNKIEDQNTTKNDPKIDKGRGRDRAKTDKGKSNRGRGRGRGENNLIQTSGIFSEGLADVSTRRSSGFSYRDRDSSNDRDVTSILQKPKLSIPQKVNKAEEAEKLKELLRDDFIDDGMEIDEDNAPIMLPMNEAKLFKSDNKFKLKDNRKSKTDTLSNGEVKSVNHSKQITLKSNEKETKTSLSVPQILEASNPNNFILLQLPDCLPGVHASSDQTDPRSKRETESSSENKTDKTNKYCTLNDFKEGMLGKLQILSSGKTRLILGENNIIVELGSNVSFRQDLIAAIINSDKQKGDLVNIGRVNSTLICVPDWEDLLKIL